MHVALHAGLALSQATAQWSDVVHAVQPGETLFALAARYTGRSDSWLQLQQYNGIADPHRIALGSRVRIPAALLASASTFATASYVAGRVRQVPPHGAQAQFLQSGARLGEGTRIEVGADGYVRLQMSDGSTVRIPANSQVRLVRVRRQDASQSSDTLIQLEAGRVDASARPQRNKASRFEIRTPLAVASVRGTEFGVAMQPDAGITGEVTQGVVDLKSLHGKQGSRQHRLREGQGARVSSAGVMGPVRSLPEAPDLVALPDTVTDIDFVRLPLPAVPGIAAYRIRISRDPAMEQIVRNGVSTGAAAQFAGLEDGDYVVGARAMDDSGLSGRESTRKLRVKARPVAPLSQRPAPGDQVIGRVVEFSCAQPAGVRRFRLQVASDESFQTLLIDDSALTECRHSALLPRGRYFWRVASVGATPDGTQDQGPFSGSRAFEVVEPPPAAPPPKASSDDGALQVYWSAQAGYRYLVQVSRGEDFADLVFADTRSEASLRLADLAPGTYHVRIQAIAPDGEAGSFSPPQVVRIGAVLRDASGGAVRDAGGNPVGRQ
ncbi:FecR domain-containing protein [Variovorax sp. WS11]|uniref:FecR domain-containing protein n=1 Tax=Variovorax sp. WS11 TaxID=1105204 RepID=UPI0013DD4017|nr:FecR domain-containing protein [Variovorax sp. WS11]NDZ13475.1 LysM peptidoglycan-binding domain-containing protein [Variovorax sp. WS11]